MADVPDDNSVDMDEPTRDLFAPRARIDQLLLEGLASGPPIEANEAWWETRRAAIEPR